MALPTGISPCTMMVEYSLENTAWIDISDFASAVDGARQTRITADGYVFGEDTAVITRGKREPVDNTFRYFYSEGTGDPFEIIRPLFEAACGGLLIMRWSPQGSATGNFSFTTSTTQYAITEFQYPMGEGSSADPIMGEFVVRSGTITKAVRA